MAAVDNATAVLGLPLNRRVSITHDALAQVVDTMERVAQCRWLMRWVAFDGSIAHWNTRLSRHHRHQSFSNQLLANGSEPSLATDLSVPTIQCD